MCSGRRSGSPGRGISRWRQEFFDALPPRAFRYVIQMGVEQRDAFSRFARLQRDDAAHPRELALLRIAAARDVLRGRQPEGAVAQQMKAVPAERDRHGLIVEFGPHGRSSAHSSRSEPSPATAPYAAAPPESRSDRLSPPGSFSPDQRLAVFKHLNGPAVTIPADIKGHDFHQLFPLHLSHGDFQQVFTQLFGGHAPLQRRLPGGHAGEKDPVIQPVAPQRQSPSPARLRARGSPLFCRKASAARPPA